MITLIVYQLANLGVVNMIKIKPQPGDYVDDAGINPNMVYDAINEAIRLLKQDGHKHTDAFKILDTFMVDSECVVYLP